MSSAASTATFKCVHCDVSLVEDALWEHVPKVHGHLPNSRQDCPICKKSVSPFAVHLHDEHGPPSRVKRPPGWSETKPTYTFALVVCRHPETGKILIIEEPASWGWWLPADLGRVDPGETLVKGALREAKEEAGIDVVLKGILRFQYVANPLGGGRQLIFFYAEPKDVNQPLKSEPDYESRGAKWATLEEIEVLHKEKKLRGSEPLEWAKYLANKGAIYPMDVLLTYVMPN